MNRESNNKSISFRPMERSFSIRPDRQASSHEHVQEDSDASRSHGRLNIPAVSRTVSMSPDTEQQQEQQHQQLKMTVIEDFPRDAACKPRVLTSHAGNQQMLFHHHRHEQESGIHFRREKHHQLLRRQSQAGAVYVPSSPAAVSDHSKSAHAGRPLLSPPKASNLLHKLAAVSSFDETKKQRNINVPQPRTKHEMKQIKRLKSTRDSSESALHPPQVRGHRSSSSLTTIDFEKRCKLLEQKLKRHEMERKCLQWRVHRLECTVKSLQAANEEPPTASRSIKSGSIARVPKNAKRKLPKLSQTRSIRRRYTEVDRRHATEHHQLLYPPQLYHPARGTHQPLHHFPLHRHHQNHAFFPPAHEFRTAPWNVPRHIENNVNVDDANDDFIPHCIRFYDCYNGSNCLPADEDLSDDEDDDDECEHDGYAEDIHSTSERNAALARAHLTAVDTAISRKKRQCLL